MISVLVSKRKLCIAFISLVSALGLGMISAPAEAQATTEVTSKRVAYRVSGWEHDLVKGDHNLGQFYWDPMTRYRQLKGSRRTGKGASAVAPAKQISRYIKPKTAPMPVNERAAEAYNESRTGTSVNASLRFNNTKAQLATNHGDSSNEAYGVLSYGDHYVSPFGQGASSSSKSQKLSVKAQLYGKGRN